MVSELLESLARKAEQIRNTDPQSLHTMEVGDEFRQGDLRVIRLPDDFVRKAGRELESTRPVSQLAPGSTQGSRHILKETRGVKFYRLSQGATALDGPIIETSDINGITHPEHGHVANLPAGCYAFPGQRAFAEELRRTQD